MSRMIVAAVLLSAGLAGVPPAPAQSTTLARTARDAMMRRAEPAAPPALRFDPDDQAAASSDYLLHCSGCHRSDGAGHPRGRIPPLAGHIGHFLSLPDGRAYLLQVPGVNGAGLDDARIARLMNWMVRRFAGASLPADFEPYDPEEVRRARRARPSDIAAHRRLLARLLAEAGRPVDY